MYNVTKDTMYILGQRHHFPFERGRLIEGGGNAEPGVEEAVPGRKEEESKDSIP